MLWFNGGPGCSSMLGYAQEIGPFVIENGEYMPYKNPYAWNTNASVWYLEQPATVGYSLCPDDSECTFTDELAATDNLEAVKSWFAKFPEYKNHDFYLTGESYGGIYLPMLAQQILEFNAGAAADQQINLKGMAIGNGVTDWTYDTTPAFLEMGFYHGLVGWTEQDGFDALNCIPDYKSDGCQPYVSKFDALVQDLNPYDIYDWHDRDFPVTNPDYARFLDEKYKTGMREKQKLLKANPGFGMETYLNNQEWRTAFHIDESAAKTWSDCNNTIKYTMGTAGTIGLYQNYFPGKGLKVLHYSGDTDGVVATLGTLNWITKTLQATVTEEWAPWYTPDMQLGGYFQGYNGLNFTTVHGTGHMVPQWKRVQAH